MSRLTWQRLQACRQPKFLLWQLASGQIQSCSLPPRMPPPPPVLGAYPPPPVLPPVLPPPAPISSFRTARLISTCNGNTVQLSGMNRDCGTGE